MQNFIKNFFADESGAVTVDWVVLTAAIVGLGVAAIGYVSKGINSMGDNIAQDLSGKSIGTGVSSELYTSTTASE